MKQKSFARYTRTPQRLARDAGWHTDSTQNRRPPRVRSGLSGDL